MLAGEYSVLSPLGSALALTTTPRLTLECEAVPAAKPRLTLTSAYWTQPLEVSLIDQPSSAESAAETWYEQVARAAFKRSFAQLEQPYHVTLAVDRSLDISFGLGSSSALTLASFAALASAAETAQDSAAEPKSELLQAAYQMVARSNAQGEPLASGYDLVTQWHGGLVQTTPFDDQWGRWPYRSQQLAAGQNLNEQLQIWVGGKGAPTTKVVGGVLANLKLGYEPGLQRRKSQLWPPGGDWLSFCELSDRLVEQMSQFLVGDEERPSLLLMTLVKLHRQHLHSVQPPEFQPFLEALANLPDCDESFTFKTTGAGGEDALLLIGPPEHLTAPAELLSQQGWYRLPGQPTGQGLRVESLS